jgi:hypothetical protein
VAMIDDKTLVLLGVGDIMFIIRWPSVVPSFPRTYVHPVTSGTGEYDETVLLHALKGLLVVLKSLYFEKTPTEALIIEVFRLSPRTHPNPLTNTAALRKDVSGGGGNDMRRRAGAHRPNRERQELQDDVGRGVMRRIVNSVVGLEWAAWPAADAHFHSAAAAIQCKAMRCKRGRYWKGCPSGSKTFTKSK